MAVHPYLLPRSRFELFKIVGEGLAPLMSDSGMQGSITFTYCGLSVLNTKEKGPHVPMQRMRMDAFFTTRGVKIINVLT